MNEIENILKRYFADRITVYEEGDKKKFLVEKEIIVNIPQIQQAVSLIKQTIVEALKGEDNCEKIKERLEKL